MESSELEGQSKMRLPRQAWRNQLYWNSFIVVRHLGSAEDAALYPFMSHSCCISTLPQYPKSRTQAHGAAITWSIVIVKAEEEKKVTYPLSGS